MRPNIIKLLTGTNDKNGECLVARRFNDLSWWSDNLETLAHYYEGAAVEITVELDPRLKMEYVRELDNIDRLNCTLSNYTYGYMEVACPKGATWYSFSGGYLRAHVIGVKYIFPDLSEFNE